MPRSYMENRFSSRTFLSRSLFLLVGVRGEFDHFNYKVFDAPVEREDQSTGNEKAAVARTVNKIPCSPRFLTTEGALDVEFEPKIRGA